MELTYIGGIDCNQFCHFLSAVENRQGYIYKDVSINAFTIYYGAKNNSEISQNLMPLSFWDIIHFSRSYKRELLENPSKAASVARQIDLMCNKQHQKIRSKSYFLQVCATVADFAKNYFSGYGFVSTFYLGKQLCQDLSRVEGNSEESLQQQEQVPQPVINPSFVRVEIRPEENSNPAPRRAYHYQNGRSQNQRNEELSACAISSISLTTSTTSTITMSEMSQSRQHLPERPLSEEHQSDAITRRNSGRTAELRKRFAPPLIIHEPFVATGRRNSESGAHFKAYKRNEETLQHVQTIFMNVTQVEGLTSSSLVGLIKTVCESNEIDFSNELCIKIVSDVFNQCTRETCDQTIDWLKTQKLSLSLLRACLNKLISKGNLNQTISLYAFLELLLLYKKRMHEAANKEPDSEGAEAVVEYIESEPLDINDPTLISGMTLLLKLSPNDNRTLGLLESLLRCRIPKSAMEDWLKVFKEKEESHTGAVNFFYPAKEMLLDVNTDDFHGEDV